MGKIVRKCAWGVFAVLLATQTVQAAAVIRTDFDPGATEYDFTGAPNAATVITSGNLTVSGGVVTNGLDWPGMTSPQYYDGDDSTPIRLDFSSPVSAIGMNFFANHVDPTLTLYDATNTVLESHTVSVAGLPTYDGYPYGFIGIDYDSNDIAYAIIDTPLNGNELYIDGIIYQAIGGILPTVPAPGAIVLGMLGTGLVGWMRRRKTL